MIAAKPGRLLPAIACVGGRPQITVTPTGTADIGATALEYCGLSTATGTGALDVMSHASGTTGSTAKSVASGATAPTTAAGELALGLYVDSGFGDTLTGASGYATRANVSPTADIESLTEDQVVSAGSTPNATVGTGPSTTWLMATLVFNHG